MTIFTDELLPYIPRLVISHVLNSKSFSEKSDSESFEAVAFFADISGFTMLTEQLVMLGPQGVETLSKLLNDYFTRLTDLVISHGGDAVNFAGDGLLAIWRINSQDEQAKFSELAVQCAQSAQKELHGYETVTGAKLSLRIGVGAGNIHAFYINEKEERREYFLTGSAIEQAHYAENSATPGDIILSRDIWELVKNLSPDYQAKKTVKSNETFRLSAAPIVKQSILSDKPSLTEKTIKVLQGFLPFTVTARLMVGQDDWIGELRRATVLFVNLKDFTEKTSLDEISKVIHIIQEVVLRFEGTINKIGMDDKGISPMIVFGLPPYAHEDDPLRGVLAAQEISKKLAFLGQPHAIGITTGRIFSGSVGSSSRREYTVMGDIVNTSARLMQAAMSGEYLSPILCDAGTQQGVHSRVGFSALKPIQLKGKSEAVPIFHPLDDNSSRQMAHHTTNFIGRVHERNLLQEILSQLSQKDFKKTVVIEGDAGIGKSCLLENFQEHMKEKGIPCYVSAGDAVEKNTIYFSWRAIFRQLFGIEAMRDADEKRKQVLSQLSEKWRDWAALLNPILNLEFDEPYFIEEMSGEVRAENVRAILLELLQTAAKKEPLVILIEDAHWLDSASWALIVEAGKLINPFLLVISMRPVSDYAPSDLRRVLSDAQTKKIVLDPLSTEEALELVKQRLGIKNLPRDMADLIRTKAEGNPFFSEELAYSLRDSKLIEIREETCNIVHGVDLKTFSFPDTVYGVVTSRIDRLPQQEQLCIKVASVIGRIFTYQTLHDIHPIANDKDHLQSYLLELEKLDLTPLEAPDPELAYIFKHAITQDVAYNLMLFAQRQELHKATAHWYEKNYMNDLSSLYPALAHHWHYAGDHKKELYYLEEATQQALDTFANQEAISFVESILQINEKFPITDKFRQARWHRQLGLAYKGLGNMETSRIHLQNALKLMGYPIPNNQAGWMLDLVGQLLKRIFFPVKKKPSNSDEISQIKEVELVYEKLSEIFFFAIDLPPFLACLLRLLNLVDQIGTSPEMARIYGAATLVSGLIPLHGIATSYEGISRKIVDQLGQFEGFAYTMFSISLYNLGIGKFDQARIDMERAVESVTFLNNRPRMAEVFTVIAQVYQRLGQYDKSMDFFERTYQAGLRAENPQHQAWGLNGKAGILLYQGQNGHVNAAIDLMKQSLPLLAGSTDHTEDIRAYGMLGIAHLRNSESSLARECADKGLHFISTTSPTAHDAMEGYAGVAETYMILLESNPHDKELSKLANKAIKGLLKCGQLFPIAMPRYWCYRGWLEWINNKPDQSQKSWQTGQEMAQKFSMTFEEARILYERGRHLDLSNSRDDLQKAADLFKLLKAEYNLEQTTQLT